MTLEGTVVNGAIVLDGGVQLPDGARVRIEVTAPEEVAFPPEPYDRAQELTRLRASLEDVRAGRGIPFEDFMAGLAAEYQFPPAPPE